MYRSLTKLVVLRAMSSTLKFHFAVNYESYRFDYLVRQKDGDPGAHKVAHQFSAHFCLVKALPPLPPPQLLYGVQKSNFHESSPSFFQVH